MTTSAEKKNNGAEAALKERAVSAPYFYLNFF